ncbi:hypothetical protein ACJA23_01030 [Mycoplasma corogypsi]|uniref:hypothetical protein n=1 Tax=Mycoplasma corogypsi TaxID=2106 RepID=UPI003872EA66
MKKFRKLQLLSLTLATTLPLSLAISCNDNPWIEHAPPEEDAKPYNTNVIDRLKEADVNFFHVGHGVQLFNNILALSMIAPTETHLYIWPRLPIQAQVNQAAYLDFVHNHKKLPEGVTDRKMYLDSTIEEVPYIDFGANLRYYYDTINDYALKYPAKKINVWFNADHIKDYPSFIKLTQLPNVYVIGIEDANIISGLLLHSWHKNNERYVKDGKIVDLSFKDWITRENQYLMPALIPNKKYINYITVEADAIQLRALGYKNTYPFFPGNDSKTIKDVVFETRDINNKRLFSYWPLISGVDWTKQRDLVKKVNASNNKKSLILIGTGETADRNVLIYLLYKHGKDYNIYYKGHPGHNYNTQFIEDNIVAGATFNVFDPELNQNILFNIPQGYNVVSLETQMQSEELTTNHATAENGLFFDKFAFMDITSGAVAGIDNKVNTPNDVVLVYNLNDGEITTPKYNGKNYFNQSLNNIYRQIINRNFSFSINRSNLDNLNISSILITKKNQDQNNNVKSIEIKNAKLISQSQDSVVLELDFILHEIETLNQNNPVAFEGKQNFTVSII